MNEYGGFVRAVDDRKIAGYRNRLVAGFSSHEGEQSRSQYINIFGTKGALRGSVEQESTNNIFYVEDSFYVLPSAALVAGFQHVCAGRVQSDNPLRTGDQSFDGSFTFTNPKIGFLWDVTPNAQIFGNISKATEASTFSELPTAITSPGPTLTRALELQKAVTYEIGTRGAGADFNWQAALYRSDLENEYQCITTTANTAFCLQTNLPRSIHQGVEVGGGAALVKGLFETGSKPDSLWINAAYTFSDFEFDGDAVFGNNQLPGQPKHYLAAEVLYKHSSGFYVGPTMEYVGSYFVNNINTMSVDAYTLWGAKLGFNNGGRISGYVEARNLFDERYISSANIVNDGTATSTIYYPGNGRAIYSGIQFRW